jgi:hypothetical protein
MSLFLNQEELQEYEKQFKYFISEAVNDIAKKVEKRLIEKMLTAVDDTPTEFKVENKPVRSTCPNSGAGGEHFVIDVLNQCRNYRYLCRCGADYDDNHNSTTFGNVLKGSIVGAPEYILWAALYEGNLFKRGDYPNSQSNIGGKMKMKKWVEMMKERHCKNILVQKQLEKTVKEKEELRQNIEFLNQKCVDLNAN